MPRRVVLPLALIGVILVVMQFALPAYLEGRVEDRVTERGGTANVDLSALPAARLLFKDGDRLELRGSGYDFPLDDPGTDVFDEVDGFDEVEIDVTNFTVGPFDVERFRLERGDGDEAYEMEVAASATAVDLAGYAGEQLGGPLGGFLGRFGGDFLPASGEAIPVDLEATLESEGGQVRAREVDGTVAGVPAGPLAEALAGAVAARL
jgi:hypothetical protein